MNIKTEGQFYVKRELLLLFFTFRDARCANRGQMDRWTVVLPPSTGSSAHFTPFSSRGRPMSMVTWDSEKFGGQKYWLTISAKPIGRSLAKNRSGEVETVLTESYSIVSEIRLSSAKKIWTSDKSWEPAKLAKLDTLDMLNNFCFHFYAQKSLSHSL